MILSKGEQLRRLKENQKDAEAIIRNLQRQLKELEATLSDNQASEQVLWGRFHSILQQAKTVGAYLYYIDARLKKLGG